MGAPRGVVLDGEKIKSLIKDKGMQHKQVVNSNQIRMLQRAIQGKSVRKSSAQMIAKGLKVDLHELYQDPDQDGGFERYINIQLKKVESLSEIPSDVMAGNQNPDVLIDMEVDVRFGIADPSEELAEKCAQLIELLEAITKQSKSSTYIRNCGKLNKIITDLNESGISIYMGHYKFRKGVWPYIDGFDREIAMEAIVDHALVVFADNAKSQTITREVDQGTSLEDLKEHVIETQKLLDQESKNELDEEGKFWLNKMRKESQHIFYDLRV